MRPHPPPSPLSGYLSPPLGPRPAHGNANNGLQAQLSRPAAPVPPSIPGLNRAKMDHLPAPPQGGNLVSATAPREPAPPGQSATAANRYDRSHMYKQVTKLPEIKGLPDMKGLPEIKHEGLVAGKQKAKKLLNIDGHSEPVEGKEPFKFPAIPGATEAAPPSGQLQPIPRVRPMSPKGHSFQPHHFPAPPSNPKKQIHRVRPLHTKLQKVTSLMDAGPCRVPTPTESASYDPLLGQNGNNLPTSLTGVRLDLPSPVNVHLPPSSSANAFQTSTQERVVLSPSCLEQVAPGVSASKSNKALEELGTKSLKPHPPKEKSGNHGAGGGARRRHYRC